MIHKFYLIVFFAIAPVTTLFSQNDEAIQKAIHFSGNISATNNGISILPTFSLGKPAAIFDFSVGSKRLSFDPQFRFSLEGKPWSFVFWGRYKVVNNDKFHLTVGAHPAITFKEQDVLSLNDNPKRVMTSTRYFATELSPSISITKNTSMGIYYLYSHGLDLGTINNTHFVTLNSSFSNLKLFSDTYVQLQPQFYYLKMDSKDGVYFSSSITLTNKKVPLAISYFINQKFHSTITNSKDFNWNLSLIYSFSNNYVKK